MELREPAAGCVYVAAFPFIIQGFVFRKQANSIKKCAKETEKQNGTKMR
jgi:hypothetical protein